MQDHCGSAYFGGLEFGVEFESSDRTETYSYRNIVIAQAFLLLLVFAVMFFTNAGLPSFAFPKTVAASALNAEAALGSISHCP